MKNSIKQQEMKICIRHNHAHKKTYNPFSRKQYPKYDPAIQFFKSDLNEPQEPLSYMNKSAGGANMHDKLQEYCGVTYDFVIDVFMKHIPSSVKSLVLSLNNFEKVNLESLVSVDIFIFNMHSGDKIFESKVNISELVNKDSFIACVVNIEGREIDICPEIHPNKYDEQHQYEHNNLIGLRKTYKEIMGTSSCR